MLKGYHSIDLLSMITREILLQSEGKDVYWRKFLNTPEENECFVIEFIIYVKLDKVLSAFLESKQEFVLISTLDIELKINPETVFILTIDPV